METYHSASISSTRAAARFCSQLCRSRCYKSLISKEHSFNNSFLSLSVLWQIGLKKNNQFPVCSSDFADSSKLVFGCMLQNSTVTFLRQTLVTIFEDFVMCSLCFVLSSSCLNDVDHFLLNLLAREVAFFSKNIKIQENEATHCD